MTTGCSGRMLAALVSVACALASPALGQGTPLPKVLVVATGGTIAGEQQQPGTLGSYAIKKSVNEIVALMPNVQRYAQVGGDADPDPLPPVVAVKHLMPTKARTLMMLALTTTRSAADIQKIFDSY